LKSEELIDRARSLAPGIAARARKTEAARTPHDETIQELIDAELMQTLVPKRWGGHELGIETHVEIIEILSAACMSTGWIAAFYLGHNWFVAKLSDRAQAEVFADRPFGLIPVATAPTMKVEREADGFRVSGRASWGSGIMHADWAIVGGMVPDEGPFMLLLPASDIEHDDVWHMSGMSGTGSNDIVVTNAFVPEHRSVATETFIGGVTEGSATHANPFYSIPLFPFLYCEAMPVFSGGLRGATNAFDATVQARVTSHGLAAMKESQYAHVLLGGAHAKADVAEILVREQVRRTLAYHTGAGFDLEQRLQLKGQAAFLVCHCREAVTEMMQHAGTENFRDDAPLQRFFRDLNMLATHAFWDWDMSREQWGRYRVGLDLNSPLV